MALDFHFLEVEVEIFVKEKSHFIKQFPLLLNRKRKLKVDLKKKLKVKLKRKLKVEFKEEKVTIVDK